MLSNIKKMILFLPAGLFLIPSLVSCGNNGDYIYLKVLNSEDYIYKYDPDEECTEPDLTVQFENYINPIREKEGKKKVKVVYDTFDTMENMFNTLKTGKTKYDLVCASEYMIQKLAKLDLIVPLEKENIPNYFDEEAGYCSHFIKNKLNNIPAKGGELKEGETLFDYTVCYMWGTLGIIYNPNLPAFKSKGSEYTPDKIHEDMKSWDSLWGETNNSKYKKTISIKDSMRDTYAIGLMYTYKSEFEKATEVETRQKLFDYGGEDDPLAEEHINAVKNNLLKLRNNIFGFEVDSGKDDIVTQKVGIDTAWSGDAVYSMNQGDKAKQPVKLYYSIPDIGTNLWFDCWAMQKGANTEVANAFLDFISEPSNAIQNMDYIGYTSPIAYKSNNPEEPGTFEYFQDKYKYKPEQESKQGKKTSYDLSYFFSKDGAHSDDYVLQVHEDATKRQLRAQFPPIVISGNEKNDYKFMIMKDYGKNNDLILKMWEEVKHESLPTWAIILLSVEVAAILFGVGTLIFIKVKDKKRRKLRRAQ